MEEKNELNDIILNKNSATSGNKKIILAVATLGIILVVVVLLMNTLTSDGTKNLPQAVLPPEPQTKQTAQVQEEPLFEEVEVVQEDADENSNLDKIAQRLKQESMLKEEVVPQAIKNVKETPKKPVAQKEEKKVQKQVTQKHTPTKAHTKSYYVQVGSFSRYEPNKKFLKSITSKGFQYKYHKVTKGNKTLNKVLVGPFKNEREARDALRTIRSSIEAGAFVVKI